jgi:electron transfer flavoprotein alpha subunit
MKTLVWVEHDGASVKDATLSTVTAASQLGEVHLLVAGQGVGAVADAAAKLAGVGTVHVADDAAYAHALAENVAPLVAKLMETHDAFFVPATTNGKNIAPRVAALLDVMQISDILSVENEDTFTPPDLRRQCDRDGADQGCQEGHLGARHRVRQGRHRRRLGHDRSGRQHR